jgi:hypothetical protein
VRGALTADRLRARVGLDDAIGGSLAIAALVLMTLIGVHDARRPVYGPIDEVTHTAYVLAVAKDGLPPMLTRDRAFIRPSRQMAPRDVLIPFPEKGSASVPFGAYGELSQTEAIQPPLYYYAAAPITWFVSGTDIVVALRLFDVLLCLCALLIVFFAVRDIGGSPLGAGIAALLVSGAGGLIDIFSFVTNGALMLTLGAALIWLSARGLRDRRLTWPLALVAAGLALTQIIVVPLAALCLLAPAIRQLREQGKPAQRTIAIRVATAGIPLGLWVLSNLYRYHWVVPRAPGDTGGGIIGYGGASTAALGVPRFANTYWSSLVNSITDSFHWFQTSPYDVDWRPLSLFLVLTFAGIACVLFRGSQQQREAVGLWLVAVVVAHLSVFCMLYLAVVLTGGGDFVYRYFSAEEAAAACLAGTCFGALFRNPAAQRTATLIVGALLIYWTYQASPL